MDADFILDKLAESVSTWNIPMAEEYARVAMDNGVSAEDAINKGLSRGMECISEMFDEGQVFLPQIIAASKAMENALKIIEPHLDTGEGHLNGIIVMGNEGNGISEQVKAVVTHKLFIPNYPEGSITSESLNVAIATAITCAEFRRRG